MNTSDIRDFKKMAEELTADKRELFYVLLKEKGIDISSFPIIPQKRESNILPMSFAQQRLWFIDQLNPGTNLYNVAYNVKLSGSLHTAALEKSLIEIVRRHEILRTSFTTVNMNPVQVIAQSQHFHLPMLDLTHLPESEREAEALRIVATESKKPFDLSQVPLVRPLLLRLDKEKHLLHLCMHHIITDAWSMGLIIQEIAALYKAFLHEKTSPLPELPIQYGDYSLWQQEYLRGDVLQKQVDYWKKQLEDQAKSLKLPLDRPRPEFLTSKGATFTFEIPEILSKAMMDLCRSEDVTLFMMGLAVLQVLLYRYSGQNNFNIGTPILNRNRSELEKLIGFFVNTLVLKCDLSGNPTFRELLKRVREITLGAYSHQEVPFEKLVEELHPERDMGQTPLFQVMFVLHNAPMTSVHLDGLITEVLEVDFDTAKFDIIFNIMEHGERLTGMIEYNIDLFNENTIARMTSHYQVLLENIVENPEQHLDDLSILTVAEKVQLLQDWAYVDVEESKITCLHQLFEAQVARSPEATALVFQDQCLTYEEVNTRANQLAHYLQHIGVKVGVTVGLGVERSPEIIIGLLGILKAGGIYVPLNPEYPQQRLQYMVQDAGVAVLLTYAHLQQMFHGDGHKMVLLDRDWEKITQLNKDNPDAGTSIENSAYIIYTSGSTGMPKGVVISHGAISRHILYMARFYQVTPDDRYLQFADINFDASIEQIFSALISGAQLVLRDSEVWIVSDFCKKIEQYALTIINLPPAYWEQLTQEVLQYPEVAARFAIRLVIIGGDAIQREALQRWQQTSLRSVKLLNAYGPTETTITSTIFDVPPDFSEEDYVRYIPIGRPLGHRCVYILDNQGKLVPVGIPGELHIGGACLADGYLNRADLTAERFIPDTFSHDPRARLYKTGDLVRYLAYGNIEFLGRIDHQVKIRGYRIELGEIDAVLNQHDTIQEGVVVLREDEPGDKRLAAYLVTNGAFNQVELRNDLRQKLPDYMIPSVFVTLDELPKTPIGKIDRKALPVPDQDRPELKREYVAPTNPVEQIIADLWAEILKVERVGIHDNFFDLGGHSMMATQIITRLRNTFHVEIPLRKLFESPTVATLAITIAEAQAEQVDDAELGQILDELDGLSEEEVEKLLVGE